MTNFKIVTLTFLLFTLIFQGCQNASYRSLAGVDGFDEVYGTTGDNGQVRPVYRGVIELYKSLSDEQKRELQEKSLKDFQGDNALLMLPRVLAEDEYATIQAGVNQRSQALRAFLKDHYSGKKKYLKDGIIPKDVLTRIINRSHEADWEENIKPENLNFWYGPDIIRGPPTEDFPEGRFLVVEDNPSFIGGMGDLNKAREILDNYMPEYQEVIGSPSPKSFYRQITASYKKAASKNGGIAIAVQYPHSMAADNEDKRTREIMKEHGIETVTIDPYKDHADSKKYPKLKVTESGVFYLKFKGAKPQRVGHLIANMNPQDLEPSHPANRTYRAVEEAQWLLEEGALTDAQKENLKSALKPDSMSGEIKIKRLEAVIRKVNPWESDFDKMGGLKGLTKALKKGQLSITNSTGTEFIGDKEFYIYVDKLIEYYLGEKPILGNMPSGSFAKLGAIDEEAIREVFGNFEKYVVKVVDGRGGKGVYVGPKTPPDQIEELLKEVRENPARYIWQEYNTLSTIEGHIGDIRVISNVSKETIVSNVPWARVVGMDGDGKVNISSNGFEATVMIRPSPSNQNCAQLMRGVLLLQ